MALDFMRDRGIPLERQTFDWRSVVLAPISKLNDDAFTRVRIILMNAMEQEANRFQHSCARMSRDLRVPLARVRRIEQHQQTLVNWLLPPDQSPLETTIAYKQAEIEITAAAAMREPDPYLQQVYRFGVVEDLDHLYRYAALLDRVCGKDANNILQCHTDICPGRPTVSQHRSPEDDVRMPYKRRSASILTKLHALTVLSLESQTRDYLMNVGPLFADPVARQLYAEIASIEEQHATHYGSIIDPEETWMEKWVLHEAAEVYTYYSCYLQESNPRIKEVWDRFVNYELGHLHFAMDLLRSVEGRDPAEILPATMPDPIDFTSHRAYLRDVLASEVELAAYSERFVPKDQEPERSIIYRDRLTAAGSPSQAVAAGYHWSPGTEVAARALRGDAGEGAREVKLA